MGVILASIFVPKICLLNLCYETFISVQEGGKLTLAGEIYNYASDSDSFFIFEYKKSKTHQIAMEEKDFFTPYSPLFRWRLPHLPYFPYLQPGAPLAGPG